MTFSQGLLIFSPLSLHVVVSLEGNFLFCSFLFCTSSSNVCHSWCGNFVVQLVKQSFALKYRTFKIPAAVLYSPHLVKSGKKVFLLRFLRVSFKSIHHCATRPFKVIFNNKTTVGLHTHEQRRKIKLKSPQKFFIKHFNINSVKLKHVSNKSGGSGVGSCG